MASPQELKGAAVAAVVGRSACQRLLLPSGLVKNHLDANGKANGCLPRTRAACLPAGRK